MLYMFLTFAVGIPSFVIYYKHEVLGSISPHPITWLIWFVTQVAATVGMWIGGGGYGMYYYVFYSFTILLIFCTTLYMNRGMDVVLKDVICLVVCTVGIAIWAIFDNPVLGVVILTLVDVYAFYPTYRKSFYKPWSESMWGWGLSVPIYIFSMLAMSEYNPLTIIYPVGMLLCTIILMVLLHIRRKSIMESK